MNKSCLLIKNDGIGDLVLTSGIINSISNIFNGELDLLTCSSNHDIANEISGLRNRIYVSRNGLRFNRYLRRFHIYAPDILPQDKKILQELSSINYDYAICLRRFIRGNSLLLMQATNASYKYCAWQFPTESNWANAEKYSHGWRHFCGDLSIASEISYFKSFTEHIFGVPIDARPRLRCMDEFASEPEHGSVGLCLGGTVGNWPVENWSELVGLLQKQGCRVRLFGGEDIQPEATEIANKHPGCVNFAGKNSFVDLLPELKKLSALIGNETGFTHLPP